MKQFNQRLIFASLAVFASATAAQALPINAKCDFSTKGIWQKERLLSDTVEAITTPFRNTYGNKSDCDTRLRSWANRLANGQDATKTVVFKCAPNYSRFEAVINSVKGLTGEAIVVSNLWDENAEKFLQSDLPNALKAQISSVCTGGGGSANNTVGDDGGFDDTMNNQPRRSVIDWDAMLSDLVNTHASSKEHCQNVPGAIKDLRTFFNYCKTHYLYQPEDKECAKAATNNFIANVSNCTSPPPPPREKTCGDFYSRYIGSKDAAEQAASLLIQSVNFSKDPKTCSGQIQKIRADAARSVDTAVVTDGRAYHSRNDIGSGHFCGFGNASAIDTAIKAYRSKIDTEYLKDPCPKDESNNNNNNNNDNNNDREPGKCQPAEISKLTTSFRRWCDNQLADASDYATKKTIVDSSLWCRDLTTKNPPLPATKIIVALKSMGFETTRLRNLPVKIEICGSIVQRNSSFKQSINHCYADWNLASRKNNPNKCSLRGYPLAM